jgi:hypothetical protein
MTQFLHLQLHNVNVLVDFNKQKCSFKEFPDKLLHKQPLVTGRQMDENNNNVPHFSEPCYVLYCQVSSIIYFFFCCKSSYSKSTNIEIKKYVPLITIWRITYYYSILIRSFLKELSK